MLLSSPIGGAPAFLLGLGAAPTTSAALQKLQAALVQLAAATHNDAIHPGTTAGTLVNGLPDDRTMAAVSASMGLISSHIPKWTAVPLSIALGVGASTNAAKKAVLDYADELRAAVIAATITAPYYVKPPTAPTPDVPQTYASSGPWYKTWWGIGAIAVGLIGTVALVRAHRANAA